MYLKLALRNVKRSYRNYLIYFLTLSFSVCLFYTFNTFDAQQSVIEMTTTQSELMESIAIIMTFLSIFISIVLAFLILYANHYLIRRRKKEFAIYMVQGMDVRHMSRILCIETLLIGIISLCTGILLGIALSQVMSAITAKLLLANVSRFHFIFSTHAFLLTMFSFFIIFILVAIFNIFVLNRYKLIDLLYANNRNEKMRIRTIPAAISVFILSLLFIGFAYHKVLLYGIMDPSKLPIIMISGAIGTFLFFFSLSGFLLQFFQKWKSFYYNGLHMFSLRQLHSSVNSAFTSMSIICLMLLLSIGALSSGININKTLSRTLKVIAPVDITFTYYRFDVESNNEIIKTVDDFYDVVEDSKLPLDQNDIEDIGNISIQTFDDKSNRIYNLTDLYPYIKEKHMDENIDHYGESSISFIRISDYNKALMMSKDANKKQISLTGDEAYVITAKEQMMDALEDVCNASDIKIRNHTFTIKNQKPVYEQPYNGGSSSEGYATFVLNDEYVDQLMQESENVGTSTYFNINLKDDVSIDDVAKKLNQYERQEMEKTDPKYSINYTSRDDVYTNTSTLTVTFTYVGMYLGIVFLLTSAVMLALQQISSADENKARYQMLKRIGVDDSMINRSLLLQIGLYFLLPLGLAIVHSYVGIHVVNNTLVLLGKTQVFDAAMITAAILIFVYGMYFYAAYTCYKSIINSKH